MATSQASSGNLILAIDTCGPVGSVALGRIIGSERHLLGQIELEGRTYSATLIAAIAGLLTQNHAKLADVGTIIAVNGPGSFTGVRIGLSAVKGLAEGAQIPVVAVSRLEVLAHKAGTACAALDAHRHEVFLRLARPGESPRELLAGAPELAQIDLKGQKIAVSDEDSITLLQSACPGAELIRTDFASAADTFQAHVTGVTSDLALLDGNYLRRSDAEIFGAPA
jgi:tRNA threonylcarbamoyladenosine biosynthesis protein TsaB